MEDHGVLIHRNSRMIRMEIIDGEVEYELEYTSGKRKFLGLKRPYYR